MLYPLPADIVSLRSVEIALSKLNIKVPFEDVVSVIREEERKLFPIATFSFPLNPSVP